MLTLGVSILKRAQEQRRGSGSSQVPPWVKFAICALSVFLWRLLRFTPRGLAARAGEQGYSQTPRSTAEWLEVLRPPTSSNNSHAVQFKCAPCFLSFPLCHPATRYACTHLHMVSDVMVRTYYQLDISARQKDSR